MTIDPWLGIVLMLNNYFHDVASALLAASAFTLWVLVRLTREHEDPGAVRYFLDACDKLTLLVKISLVWIVLGGIPRTIFYADFEWTNAAGKGQVPALILKHVVFAVLVVMGIWGWTRMKRRVAELRERQRGTM